jgi:hypothetical protein
MYAHIYDATKISTNQCTSAYFEFAQYKMVALTRQQIAASMHTVCNDKSSSDNKRGRVGTIRYKLLVKFNYKVSEGQNSLINGST